MKRRLLLWFLFLVFVALLIFIAALFLTPSFTRTCSDQLLGCLDWAYDFPWYQRLWYSLQCAFKNVVCVLKGLFV